MPLPMIGDYTDAVQNPSVCFGDPELAELAAGQPELHPRRGIPLVYSGNFAAVYPMVCGGVKYALRCFTREVNDPDKRLERYQRLSNFFTLIKSDVFVEYRYYERGIRVKGEWYPTIRMEWVDGSRLDRFVEDNLSRPDEIQKVCDELLEVNRDMKTLFIAHNDLQHGNLMVQRDGHIRLVDYDGFFLPQFQGQPSPELGHAQYQHPLRDVDDYGYYVDNFPALVIYVSLMALKADPGLWQRFYTQDNLIFTRADYADPANSGCFRALQNSPDSAVRQLADYLERCCSMAVDRVPGLEEILGGALPSSSFVPAAAPVPGRAPAPPPSGASPRPAGGGSDYRQLLQMGRGTSPQAGVAVSQPGPAPGAAAAPVMAVECPRCRRTNPSQFRYCEDDACNSNLYPLTLMCGQCGEYMPEGGNFCIMCGAKLA